MTADWRDDYLAVRDLPDGRSLAVSELTFGRVRINVVAGYHLLDGW